MFLATSHIVFLVTAGPCFKAVLILGLFSACGHFETCLVENACSNKKDKKLNI